MSRKWGGVATSSATSRVRNPVSTPKAPTEQELWPEEDNKTTQSKVVLDEFEKMEQEVILEMEKEKDTKRKKGDGEKKKKKKKKKGDSEKENKISSHDKDALYEKHVGPRIRSFDPAKMKSKFSKPKEQTQVSSECRICGKQVFQMEKIVAEKASWHKNCFRCNECNKNLTLETYQSHEGTLYCKPHFKELFKPKAVVQNEEQERKDRQMRRPRMIILESEPVALPEDVIRATAKPDYGLDELQQSLNVKERFNIFENLHKETDQPRTEPVTVKRSKSMMSKAAARLFDGEDGTANSDEEEDEEESVEEEEEEEDEEEENGEEKNQNRTVRGNKKKKERPMSFSGMGDLKAAWEQKQRREEMTQSRKEEISKFRQMLCAGKNLSLTEKFERGELLEQSDDEDDAGRKKREEIKIEGSRAASKLKKRFEQGQPFILEDEEDDDQEGEENGVDGEEEGEEKPVRRTKKGRSKIRSEKLEVEEIFKDAETAKQARNVFRQIDSKVAQEEGNPLLRSQSFANANRENRRSLDNSKPDADIVKSDEKSEDFVVDTSDLSSRFKFFMNYEKDKAKELETKRKVFRITPPREGLDHESMQGSDELLGRDPNLIKCTDNYQDDVDCRNTKNILQMFRKMEMGDDEDDDEGPRPLKRFTPPPGSAEYDEEDSEEEYTDEEYSDEDDEDEDVEDEGIKRERVRDEILQMANANSQSARKAAQLRAKFEKWESNNQNGSEKEKEELEQIMPSLDTAKNLKAMFEQKVIEVVKPVASKPITQKVNRFVGGGDRCVSCNKTVYAMEKLEIHSKILHKSCFKCHKCNTRLSMGSFSFGGGDHMYCTTHYKQLFTEKGSYESLMQEKGKWTKKIEAMNGDAIKSHD